MLYTLLKKPAPNNSNLVGERREIALMAQDMKLLLKMVRRECHDRKALFLYISPANELVHPG